MRSAVERLASLGQLPDEEDAQPADLALREELLKEIGAEPPSRAEVRALLPLLPSDDNTCFGLAWSVLHVVESSPHWPMWEALDSLDGWWADFLRLRLQNAGVARA